MKLYVVVDSNNQWLYTGECKTPQEALEQAKFAGAYDKEAEIIVYEAKEVLVKEAQ
jgi:hypothetical protein